MSLPAIQRQFGEPGENATARVAEIFRHPEDIDNSVFWRTRLERERSAIDVQLKANVQSQVETTTSGLDALQNSKFILSSIREEMIKIDRLCYEAQSIVQEFPMIEKVSRVYNNFSGTKKMVEDFQKLPGRLNKIYALMDEDGPPSFSSKQPNLLVIHYELTKLRDFRDEVLCEAQRSKTAVDTLMRVKEYLKPVDEALDRLDTVILDVAENLLEYIRDDNRGLVVRVARIVYTEEKSDAKDKAAAELANRNPKIKPPQRQPRHYLQMFLSAMENSVKSLYQNCKETFSEDPFQVIDNLDWVFNDLALAQTELVTCTPEKWKIFDRLLHAYHCEMNELLKEIVASEPDAATILKIVDWMKLYYATLKKEFKVGKSDPRLKPPLMDGKADRLVDDYRQLLANKLDEWMDNIASTESSDFVERKMPPETDPDDKFGMQSSVIAFQMINQQIELAIESGQGRVLADIVAHIVKVLCNRQKSWQQVMENEIDNVIRSPDLVPGGLEEYIIALANDQIRGADYSESMSNRISPLVSKKYQVPIADSIEVLIDGFASTAKACVSGLIRIIMNDLREVSKTIFTKSWYGSNAVRQIVDTYREYADDCKAHLNEFLFEILVDDLLTKTLVSYLSCLRNDKAVLDDRAPDQIHSDVELLYDFFSGYLPPETIEEQFRSIEHLLGFLTATSTEDVLTEAKSLQDDFWDAPILFIEDSLLVRTDWDSKRVKETMDVLKTQFARLSGPELTDDKTPTFMSDLYPK